MARDKAPRSKPRHKEEQEVAVREEAGLPSTDVIDLSLDAGAGSETVTAKDVATPIISILQANSPQCKPMDPKYIKGAIEGSLYNNVTNEIYPGETGVLVLPVYREKIFIEWRPNRGGFVAVHPEDTKLRDQIIMKKDNPEDVNSRERPTLPGSGNILAETDQHYVLVLKGSAFTPAVISMSSTALRSSRQWNLLVQQVFEQDPKTNRMFNPARWAARYRLTTKGRQKDQHTWATWSIALEGKLKVTPQTFDPEKGGLITQEVSSSDVQLYRAAQAFYKSIKEGLVKVKIEEPDEAEVTAPAADAEVSLD